MKNLPGFTLTDLATPGRPPGAVRGVSEVGAIAAAISRSAGFETTTDDALMSLIGSLRLAGIADEEAYWDQTRRPEGAWRRETPMSVAAACREVACQSIEKLSGNAIDARVGKLLAVAAEAASVIIAESNDPEMDTACSLPAAWQTGTSVLSIRSAEGAWVEAMNGVFHIDASSGLWNVPLGHRHPAPLSGFLAQVASTACLNPFTQSAPVLHRLANRVLKLCDLGGGGVFLCSSGSEAIETALRLGLATLAPDAEIWAQPGAFHGATMGASMLTAYPTLWREFERLPRLVRHASPSEWSGAGLGFVEPIRVGAGALRTREIESLHAFRRRGGIVVADEVACGLGRTFWPLAARHIDVPYDMVVLGKGLANGLVPVSCVVLSERMLERLATKGTDFGHTHSNHLGAAGAAEATLEALSRLDHDGFALQLQEMMSDLSAEAITEGSLGALRLSHSQPRSKVEHACLDEGLLIHLPTVVAAVDNLIVAPPLTSDVDTIHELSKRLRRVLHRLEVLS